MQLPGLSALASVAAPGAGVGKMDDYNDNYRRASPVNVSPPHRCVLYGVEGSDGVGGGALPLPLPLQSCPLPLPLPLPAHH